MPTDKKIPELSELTNTDLVAGDKIHVVDVSDTTDDVSGTSKYLTFSSIASWLGSLVQTLTNKTLTSPKINEDVVLTSTSTELNHVEGVTSPIQTQLDLKAPLASPTFTGTVTLPKTLEIQDTSANHQYILAVSELSADRTITLPLLAGNDEFVFKDFTQTFTNKTIGTTNLISFNSPRGFLINGKIVPSVASNDLIVEIKGLDGNDPSATNPVYCRIGDTIYSITAALSVTHADGLNWFNSGRTELATKEIDYFVYLGYASVAGAVKIGISRVPFATEYDDLSSTYNDEKYFGVAATANWAAGDNIENIGRFAATLSAGAGYTWTVPTFTNKNLIQRPIYESRWLTFTPSPTGITSPSSVTYYKINGDTCFFDFQVSGTGSATNFKITVPLKSAATRYFEAPLGLSRDNGTYKTGACRMYNVSQTEIAFGSDMTNENWTASGARETRGMFTYQIA